MGIRLVEPAQQAYSYPLLIKQLLTTPMATAASQEIVYKDRYRGTYAEFRTRIDKLAATLADLGVEPGVTVAVMDWDSHRYLECYFGVPMMGAVLQTVNVRLSPEQIHYTLEHARAEVILVHHDFVDLVAGMRAQLPALRALIYIDDDCGCETPDGYSGEYEALLSVADAGFVFDDFDENAVATTFYTTGTTGLPKAVLFTHRQIVLHTLATVAHLGAQAPEGFRVGDVYMPITPMFHVHAWGMPYAVTSIGLKQVYPGRYEAGALLNLREREGVTFSHCVPTILQMILEEADRRSADLSDWTVIVGGAAFPQALCRTARARGMNAFAGYGMSETGPLLCLTRSLSASSVASEADRVATLCKTGLPALLVQMRIVDLDMRDVPHDGQAQGEIVVRAPWLTGCYVGNEAASADLWHGGWLHTQDVATIDPNGYVQIRDRLKDVIKTGGEWVSSIVLEDLLLTHPSVTETAVIGIPDKQWGERPVAIVVCAADQETPSIDELRQHLNQYVATGVISRYALPDQVMGIDALPRTSVGKIDKKILRQFWAERSGSSEQ